MATQKNLVIVESPAKAKTIEKFLGQDYKVLSSYGHIRDLNPKKFSIDFEHNYAPQYIIPAEKEKVVSDLKKQARTAETVWLASDEDREGEAISWHLFETLELKEKTTRRIVFHEITKDAILHAIQNPRNINYDLVDAQQARRVLDRIVGFELSPVLWRKVKPSLSAGRVQSVAVRLIVEREREINAFVSEAAFRITANFILPNGVTLLKAELNKRFKKQEEAFAFLDTCKDAIFTISDITTRPVKKSPAAPFTTSTLQQEAARKLSFSVSQTMSLAQRLYEAGHITYMRTDSLNLSELALTTAKETIVKEFGVKYHKLRRYHTKSKGAQEAHEAIRPTYMERIQAGESAQEQRLYDLIRKRTLAGQMADAELERTTISVAINSSPEKFIATGEIIVFDGFLQVYMEGNDDEGEKEENSLLPPVNLNDVLSLKEMEAVERFTQRPPRYTEASLVRRLEELGIGRPSTYAPTIQTIQNRTYVIKGDKEGTKRSYCVITLKEGNIKESRKEEKTGADHNKLMPTDIGIVVNDFLLENFSSVLDYNFTADIEKDFDAIAAGSIKWVGVIDNFYRQFHPHVETVLSTRETHKAGERELGIDPKTGKPILAKIGRFGPIVQLGLARNGDNINEKPVFAAIPQGQSIETISLEVALRLFELPRTIGQFKDKDIVAGLGRFGPFLRHDSKYVSIPKHLAPSTITLDEAIALIEEKEQKEQQSLIRRFDEEGLEIRNGRYGPYITCKGKNYKIPKTVSDPLTLTLADALKLVAEQDTAPKKTRKPIRKKH
ncbi:MAG: type I DNA topoisomerase [Tannerellaceae bacterium]|jgi:DNA topoisomerase-1|nr:type I DNA topoisomerase [Tannerellaceae bacterium]